MLTQGQDERTVIQGIMASAEYFGSAHRVLWLEGVYRDVLHRGGDTVGDLGSWLAALHLSHDRTALAKSILTSTEAENLTVRSLYQHLLGRKPDASGLSAYVHLLDADGHATTLITSLVTSTEYYNLHGANTSLWIRALYQDLLNRGASDLEVQFWINKMNNGETRAQVAADFTATLEYQRDFVGGLFLSYLRRQPTTLDLSQNVTQVQGGASDATLAAALLGSPEYFALNG